MEIVKKKENQPLIVHIKEPEKTILHTYERYSRFKRLCDSLEGRVVFIGPPFHPCTPSHGADTSLASRIAAQREAKSDRLGVLFAKGGSDSLLDLSFLDSLGVRLCGLYS